LPNNSEGVFAWGPETVVALVLSVRERQLEGQEPSPLLIIESGSAQQPRAPTATRGLGRKTRWVKYSI
jgi:hypothetical protein